MKNPHLDFEKVYPYLKNNHLDLQKRDLKIKNPHFFTQHPLKQTQDQRFGFYHTFLNPIKTLFNQKYQRNS